MYGRVTRCWASEDRRHPPSPETRNPAPRTWSAATVAEIRIERISKTYPGGKTPAVDDVSLAVADREFMVLLGPSGCGKTTLLRMIAGLEFPDAGRIVIGDRDVTDLPPRKR